MIVFLVVRYYEGPEGVYSTREKAEAHIGGHADDLYVLEWEVDGDSKDEC